MEASSVLRLAALAGSGRFQLFLCFATVFLGLIAYYHHDDGVTVHQHLESISSVLRSKLLPTKSKHDGVNHYLCNSTKESVHHREYRPFKKIGIYRGQFRR